MHRCKFYEKLQAVISTALVILVFQQTHFAGPRHRFWKLIRTGRFVNSICRPAFGGRKTVAPTRRRVDRVCRRQQQVSMQESTTTGTRGPRMRGVARNASRMGGILIYAAGKQPPRINSTRPRHPPVRSRARSGLLSAL